MIVLIPAYEPDERMLELVAELEADGCRMLVVDDGSGEDYAHLFADVESRGSKSSTSGATAARPKLCAEGSPTSHAAGPVKTS